MSNAFSAALALDFDAFDECEVATPASAYVRGRDGALQAVDVSRLAWPDATSTAGVDCMADLSRRGPLSRC